jgi:hypothetical protein
LGPDNVRLELIANEYDFGWVQTQASCKLSEHSGVRFPTTQASGDKNRLEKMLDADTRQDSFHRWWMSEVGHER